MSYEIQIGWRYIFGGSRSGASMITALVAIAVAVYGVWGLVTDAGGVLPAVLATAGLFTAVLFGLLHYFSVFTSVSVLGVVLGVAALTAVLAVTSGFLHQFQKKVLGVNAHVLVMKRTHDFTEYREVEKVSREVDPGVMAVQPFVFVEMLATRGKGEIAGVAIKGVDPERVTKVLDLREHVQKGSADCLVERPAEGEPPPIIVGQELANKLNADVGDLVTVVSPLTQMAMDGSSAGRAPKTKKFRVGAIFYAGFDEYDRRLMYIHLQDAQDLVERGDVVMGVEMRVRDVERADEIADMIEKQLATWGAPYRVQDWRELNRNLFAALTLQKLALLIALTLIIAVAAFNMVSALMMMVTDKTREIAILKSMGATKAGIARIFQVVGISIGGIGTVAGLALGLSLCELISRYGYRLDPKVYLIDRLPVSVNYDEVVLVGVITMIISVLATLFPSSKASGLAPVDGLRYD